VNSDNDTVQERRPVRKIAICGCGGSGKSVLARELGRRLNLPVTHLDVLFYDEHWNPLDQETFADQQRKLVAQPQWVIDGNYASTMPIRLAEADRVIFLDLPAVTCLWGILQRRQRYRGGQHDAEGVYDRITWGFVRYILGYRRKMRPKVRRLLDEHATGTVTILTSRRAVRRFLRTLPAKATPQQPERA
jgi:adenylate kinase family enzyme